MFDSLIQQCADLVTPHAVRVGSTAEAYAQRIVARLDAIVHELQDEGPERFATDTGAAQANAAGVADVVFELRPGQRVELLSLTGSGVAPGGSTGCALYHTDPSSELNLLHVFNYGQRFSDGFDTGEYVEGATLVVRFVGQTPGQLCTARLKMKLSAPVKATRGIGGQPNPQGPRTDPDLDARHVVAPQFLNVNGAPRA